jgi:FdhD protein
VTRRAAGPTSDVEVARVREGRGIEATDVVVTEEPLEIRVGPKQGPLKALGITMRTPGHDEELAVGFLAAEGAISRPDHVVSVAHAQQGEDAFNIVGVRLAKEVAEAAHRHVRDIYATSACGICGAASLELVEARSPFPIAREGFAFETVRLRALPEALRAHQKVFAATGGLHAAALVEASGRFVCVREDVGRHNAVDKVVGRSLLDGRFPLSQAMLLVSGRAGFEILQKAAAAGIPMVAAVGAPSSLAVDVARGFGITLVGFLSKGGYNVYSGPWRLVDG